MWYNSGNNMSEGKKNSILLVDDEQTNLSILELILGTEYTTYTATNGHEAIEKARLYQPDLILLDIVMPGKDGYETLEDLKKCKTLKSIPVIFITSLDNVIFEEKGLDLDAADFIYKPFTSKIVRLRVRNQIQIVNQIKSIEQYAKAAESANNAKSEFLAKMSHEIRTPLNAILGISEIQLQNEKHSNEVRDAFFRIHNSGDMLLAIISDILDMSKIEAGKLELHPVEYDVENMIGDSVFLSLFKYRNKPIQFILNVNENVPSRLFGDELCIKQIINNLLSNAYKYTAEGSVELSVSAEFTEKNVILIIHVRDTGQGMTNDQVEKLFEVYSRFNTQTNRTTEGIGLGMNITWNLVKLMEGEILAESKFGKGSLFTIRLPQGNVGSAPMSREAIERMRDLHLNNETRRKTKISRSKIPFGKVLVVDDLDINLYVVQEMLSYYGLHVDTATSGDEAIMKITANSYDIVFMDHIMPIKDGLQTTQEIRRLGGKYEKLPIIALTANTVSGTKEMFMANGFNGFVSKPVSIQGLDEILRELITSNLREMP